jgi:hypothetical protein
MESSETSKLVFLASAVGRAPSRAQELKQIMLDSPAHPSHDYLAAIDALLEMIERADWKTSGFLDRLSDIARADDVPKKLGILNPNEIKLAYRAARAALRSLLR